MRLLGKRNKNYNINLVKTNLVNYAPISKVNACNIT